MASSPLPNPTTVTMSEVKSRILKPSLTSHYVVNITPPPAVSDLVSKRTSIDPTTINLSCSEASLPGSSLATHEINNDYTGVTERHAYRRLYDEKADFTFYVDSDYTVIDLFEGWINYIVGEGNPRTTDNYRSSTAYYRMKYPDGGSGYSGYRNDIFITKFERENKRPGRKLVYQFIKAYPTNITSMPVSYDASNLLKCTVSFTYLRYVRTTSQKGALVSVPAGNTTGENTTTKDPTKNYYGPGYPDPAQIYRQFPETFGFDEGEGAEIIR
jgi:hypothetical protein